VVKDGSTVSIEYTLKLDDGSTADTNVGGEPLVYVQGEQQILPALEDKLAGMKADESRTVVLSPEEGYGPGPPGRLPDRAAGHDSGGRPPRGRPPCRPGPHGEPIQGEPI
jgi:FKBP-type peptidyl-prolyl cis-trans isomerase